MYKTIILVFSCSLGLLAHDPAVDQIPEADQLVIEAWHPDLDEMQGYLATLDVWHIHPETGEVSFVIDRARLHELDLFDFSWNLDMVQTKFITQPPDMLPGQVVGIPGFPCYRTVEETLADAEALALANPQMVTWTDIGDSWEKTQNPDEGWDIFLMVITNSQISGDKPKLLVNSAIHAREYTTAELNTRFAEHLLANVQTDADIRWLLDHHEIHLILQANPDGRKQAETGVLWRKNANNNFCGDTNTRGIDLNRNFEFQWNCCGGSSASPCSESFHGPSAGSEPETQMLQNHILSIFPDQRPDDLITPAPPDATGIFFDVHSHGEIILSSWGFTSNPPPNESGIMALSRKLGFYNGYRPHLGSLGTVDGSTKDFAYGMLGVPSYTLELGTSFFEDCNFFEQSILPQNITALIQSAKWTRTPYITPKGPEFESVTLGAGVVEPGDDLEIQAMIDDDRYNHENGNEPVQNLQSAAVYVDVPPWSPGAVLLSMTASDGTFDSVREAAEITISSSGLGQGEHTLFFQAVDADGNPGAVKAVFFYVLDPAVAPRIEGVVRDATTGAPVRATISTGSFATTSDASGFYQMLLPEGTFTLEVDAEGYLGQRIEGVQTVTGQTTTVNVTLQPICPVFEDDMEAGAGSWTTTGTWAQTTAQSSSPTHSWTDSPGGNYGDNANMSLTSETFDFTGVQGISLAFQHRYDTESGFDFGVVEISTNNGSSWTSVASYSGDSQNWLLEELALPDLSGVAQARIRFRFDSDGSVQADGWYIDDVSILATGAGCGALPLEQMFPMWPGTFDIRDLVNSVNLQ